MNKKFFNQYFKKQSELLNFDKKTIDELKKTSDILNKVRKKKSSCYLSYLDIVNFEII